MGLEQILILVIFAVVALLNVFAELRNRRRRRTPSQPPEAMRDWAPPTSPPSEPATTVRRALSEGPRPAPKPALVPSAAAARRVPALTLAEARRGIVLRTILGPCLANERDDEGPGLL